MRRIASLLLATLFLVSQPLHAKDAFIIVAEVNGKPISNYAVDDRVDLMIKIAHLEDSPVVRQKLRFQALQMLITEAIQKAHADELKISLSDGEKARAITSLEQQNGVEPGKLKEDLSRNGIKYETFIEQMQAQLLWQKVTAKKVNPYVQVSDFEINDVLNRSGEDKNQEQIYLSEISIPVQGEDVAAAQKVAEELLHQLDNGASFGDMAKQFSAATTAADGGAIGWVDIANLAAEFKDDIMAASPNKVVRPIVKDELLHIFKVGNRRILTDSMDDKKKRIKETLMKQKVEKEAQRYMYDLRKNAYIEIRV